MPNQDVTACKVAVLAGGWSDEREVSRLSGKEVARALGEAGFSRVDLIDPAQEEDLRKLIDGAYDVTFVAMHGRMGEDGCIQGLLEVLHIPYTFSGVYSSALAMQKGAAKAVFEQVGIPVPAGKEIANTDVGSYNLDEIVAELGLPVFVKPVGNGSSFGVSKVNERKDLLQALIKAASAGEKVLVESAVEGIEVTVPVIGNDDPRALPVVEVVTGAEFYDQKVKYEPSELHHVIPARLDDKTTALVKDYAIRAHRVLGCSGCSRSDFIIQADGTPVILETNTIPGMTSASLLPDSARHAGIEFADLCRTFVELALEKRDCA